MIDDLGISGPLADVQDNTDALLADTTQLLADTIAMLARLPTGGRAASDAIWDGAKAAFLDAEISSRALRSPLLEPASGAKVEGVATTSSASLVAVHSYAGRGVLHWVYGRGVNTVDAGEVSVEVDGIVYVPATTFSNAAGLVRWVVGEQSGVSTTRAGAFELLPFNTSLVIKLRKTAGTSTVSCGYSYRPVAAL